MKDTYLIKANVPGEEMEHDEDDEAKEKGRENFEVKAERIVCCGTTTSTAASISPLSLPFDSGRRVPSRVPGRVPDKFG